MGRKAIDMYGQKFGRWTVIKKAGKDKNYRMCWLCECECGTKRVVTGKTLRNGTSKSCRCLSKERVSATHTKHGMYKSRTYVSWFKMLSRCNDLNRSSYRNYGGRGIKVCERWYKFENFLEDMSERPEGMSIERINNNKGYSPDNCKWATRKEQNRNKRTNHIIEYNGETKCLVEWAEELGINYRTLCSRIITLKHPPEVAFNM